MKAAGSVGRLEGQDVGRILDIATEWPASQRGETFTERQAGAMLKARIDNAKKTGEAPQHIGKLIKLWIMADLSALTAGNAEPVGPNVVTLVGK